MITFTGALNEYLQFTNDKSSENQTFGASQLNSSVKARLGEDDWIFLEKVVTDTTVASQQGYQLPVDFAQLRTLTVTVGSTVWPVYEAPSRDYWNQLNVITYTSDIPQYYYVIGSQVLLYPTPSSNGNTITYDYKKKVPNFNVADYTTGTITVTNGSTAVTGSGTSFTSAMAGRSLMTTDGFWYEIASVASTTALTLVKEYAGLSESGASFTIGQLLPLPDAYEQLPLYDGAADYYTKQGGFEKAKAYRELGDDLAKKMKAEQGAKSTSPRIRSGGAQTVNPNLFIRL